MSGTDNQSETLIERLALDGLVARVRDLQVSSDSLTWSRFCGSLGSGVWWFCFF